jgi:hypothetical protein
LTPNGGSVFWKAGFELDCRCSVSTLQGVSWSAEGARHGKRTGLEMIEPYRSNFRGAGGLRAFGVVRGRGWGAAIGGPVTVRLPTEVAQREQMNS